jgi:hypothetical protein
MRSVGRHAELNALALLLLFGNPMIPVPAASEEPVDSFEEFRMGHLVRTAEVWRRIQELGATEKTPLNFDFSFNAPTEAAVSSLKTGLSDYQLDATTDGDVEGWIVSGESGTITWTEEQLLKWVDYLIAVGQRSGAEFDGCGASVPPKREQPPNKPLNADVE